MNTKGGLMWFSVVFLLANCSTENTEQKGKEKPNIIFIMVDQMNADAMSAYGNEYIRTPALDRLANSGANFMNAYCTQPICGPSRASLITGTMPNRNGSVLNIPPKDHTLRQQKWLGAEMQKQGYKTAYFGKWHIDVGEEEEGIHGFETRDFRGGNGADSSTVASSIAFLNKTHKAPFFLVVSINNPHNICEWARGTRGDELSDGVIPKAPAAEVCPPLPSNFLPMESEPDFIRVFQKENPRVFPTEGWREEQWRKYIWAFYRFIELADSRIGKVLDALDNSQYSDNTLIVFTSDHGDGAAEHGWNQKSVLFENAIKIPFIVTPPKKESYQSTSHSELVSIGIDILPTLLDFAGTNIDSSSFQGRSVKRFLSQDDNTQQKQKPWRDKLVVEMTLGTKDQFFGVEGRALRFGDYKYILYKEDNDVEHELLFDLVKDPGEMNNLTDSGQHVETLQRSRSMLNDWCSEQEDDFCRGGKSSVKCTSKTVY